MQTFTIDDVSEYIKICPRDELYRVRRESQARITGINQSKDVEKKQPSQWALNMAFVLAEACKANFKFVKPVSITDWAVDIDKLNRIDGQLTEEIETVLEWSQKDEFWKRQIRSGRALRRHFEKLIIASAAPPKDVGGFTCVKHNNFVPKGKTCGYC